MPIILEEDLQKLKDSLSTIFSVINNLAADKDEVRRAKLIPLGNGLATHKKEDSQMLINVKGASVGKTRRKDGRYCGYCTIDGIRIYRYGHTIEEVQKQLTTIIKSGKAPKKKRRTALTLTSWTENWLELYKKPKVKPKTLISISDVLKTALRELGDKSIADITPIQLQQVLISYRSDRVRELASVYLAQIFEKALQLGFIKKDPCAAVEIKKYIAAPREALTHEQQRIFLDAIKGAKHEGLFIFLLSTGLRIGEALALTYNDIDFEQKLVTVTKNVVAVKGGHLFQNSTKSRAGVRKVPLPDTAAAWLPRNKDGDERVFNVTASGPQEYLRKLSKKLGFRVCPHILRHTYATRLEEMRVSDKMKQYLLGHSSERMTLHYTHIQDDYLKEIGTEVRNIFDE